MLIEEPNSWADQFYTSKISQEEREKYIISAYQDGYQWFQAARAQKHLQKSKIQLNLWTLALCTLHSTVGLKQEELITNTFWPVTILLCTFFPVEGGLIHNITWTILHQKNKNNTKYMKFPAVQRLFVGYSKMSLAMCESHSWALSVHTFNLPICGSSLQGWDLLRLSGPGLTMQLCCTKQIITSSDRRCKKPPFSVFGSYWSVPSTFLSPRLDAAVTHISNTRSESQGFLLSVVSDWFWPDVSF